MDCIPPGSSVHGILQARVLEWVAMPSSREWQCPVWEGKVQEEMILFLWEDFLEEEVGMVEQLFEFWQKRRVWPVCVCERQNSSCGPQHASAARPHGCIRLQGQAQLMGVKAPGSWFSGNLGQHLGSFPYSLLLQALTSTNTPVLADEMEW